MEDSPYYILESFARNEDIYTIPEVVYAMRIIDSPIDDALIIKLRKRLEIMTYMDWPVAAVGFVEAFHKATTDEVKIESLASVVSYDKDLSRNKLDEAWGWSTKAKRTAVQYLAKHNNPKALEAIAPGLAFYFVSEDASRVLAQSEYGIELIIEYIKKNKYPSKHAIEALLNNESDQAVKALIALLDRSDDKMYVAKILASHCNESVKAKANDILSSIRLKTTELSKDTNDRREIPIESVEVVNYQIGKERVITGDKGRKKYKFPHRNIKQRKDGSAYFKCPFCDKINEVNGDNCKHVVYGFETVDYNATHMDVRFFNMIIKLISADPANYFEDFEYYLENYRGEYINVIEIVDGQKVEIDLEALKVILEDKISPDVLEDVIKTNGIPIVIKSLIEYSLVDAYMGGGTYYYLISDKDLSKVNELS